MWLFLSHFPGAPKSERPLVGCMTRTLCARNRKASGCFMGGTCAVREEPGKRKPRSCQAQELAGSCAQENERQKKGRATELGENREEGASGRNDRGDSWKLRTPGEREVQSCAENCHRPNRRQASPSAGTPRRSARQTPFAWKVCRECRRARCWADQNLDG